MFVREVSSVHSVLLPVLQVNLLSALEQKIKFVLVKDLQNVDWDQAVKSLQKSFQLIFDLCYQVILCRT